MLMGAAWIALASGALAGGAGCEATPLPARPDLTAEASSHRELYMPLVRAAACRYGLSPQLLDALVIQESRYNPRAISRAGAIGLGQLMPGTARMLGVDPYDPAANLDGAARYLKQQLTEFGSLRLALAAYNAGPGRVRERGDVPRIAETLNYVATIEDDLARWGGEQPPAIVNLGPAEAVRDAAAPPPVAAAPPPRWDVFARFAWEQNQKRAVKGSDDESE